MHTSSQKNRKGSKQGKGLNKGRKCTPQMTTILFQTFVSSQDNKSGDHYTTYII